MTFIGEYVRKLKESFKAMGISEEKECKDEKIRLPLGRIPPDSQVLIVKPDKYIQKRASDALVIYEQKKLVLILGIELKGRITKSKSESVLNYVAEQISGTSLYFRTYSADA